MAPIRISRQGLSRCPSCKSHIKVAAIIQETLCPFCDGSLTAPTTLRGMSLVSSGRSALLAASLFASSGLLSGCLSDDSGSADTVLTDTSADTAADGGLDVEVVQDIGPVAEYGMPPDIFWDASADVEIVEDAGSMPEYGMPPDAGPLPPYGIPPDGQ
jgi:hypothetical protein